MNKIAVESHPKAIERQFQRKIRTRIFSVLRKGPSTWMQILRQADNCDPAILSEMLSKLKMSGHLSHFKRKGSSELWCLTSRNCEALEKSHFPGDGQSFLGSQFSKRISHHRCNSSTLIQELLGELEICLPEPSPVYAQWWFSKKTYHSLINLISNSIKPNTPIAFLGSSTIGAVFSRIEQHPVTILDIDDYLLKSISGICSKSTSIVRYDAVDDIQHGLRNSFEFIFVDPPWSRSLIPVFLLRAACFLQSGGSLVISFPQSLTRPMMTDEIQKLLAMSKDIGLELLSTIRNATEYAVPPFEKNAYKHAGMHINAPWRRGDLFLFRKTHLSACEYKELHTERMKLQWEQFCFGKHRLFLKRDGNSEEGLPMIKPLPGLNGGICTTTSSRASCWSSASMVSSRNLMANAEGRKQLSGLLKELQEDSNWSRAVQSAGLKRYRNPQMAGLLSTLRWILGEGRKL